MSERSSTEPPPQKRRRKGKGGLKTTGLDEEDEHQEGSITLCLDAMALVMSFVEPRELLRLSMTCKDLRNAVTTEMVVRSAMVSGGYSRHTMTEMAQLMKNVLRGGFGS